MTDRTCSIEGCDTAAVSRGWCMAHYHRWRRNGDPIGAPRPSFEERFWAKVVKTETCWLWTGRKDPNGYGRPFIGPKAAGDVLAHRAAYEMCVGPIPGDLTIDHLCRVRNCVNPEHLEIVTRAENSRRANLVARDGSHHRALRTHCANGHQFTVENTKIRANGSRKCRACDRDHAARAYLKRKGVAL